MIELQELLSDAEEPYLELKQGGLSAVERFFWQVEVLAKLRLVLETLDLDNGQLLPKDSGCSSNGSKVLTPTVNELKMRSKSGKVASVGF